MFKYQRRLFTIPRAIKGIVHSKMKITPWFTHPQAIIGVFDFTFPSFIMMTVNGGRDFEAKLTASIHHKKVLHTAPGG